ncbi:GntR family transcriptional regulator [Noviherbaspirillum sp. Root189]|uniref:GntR family transcriptional regulator n=1 Tax=Noviherbaspirillum sp. Root189 TaxID=1736487 RepID=UPI00070B5128|nr:GntR family transcriptional regulator [Noviherbaspirillum sp. Root189]KRB87051.1 GntR family transcriptional regulator [Noviherbaspirillum sp. Root189]
MKIQLPRSSTVPLYTQIKEALRAKIIDGTYVGHQQLPSESEMIAAFGVSRITVRQAINDLQKEGLLFKVHGKGTFVAMPNVSQELTQLQGFGEAMHRLGHETFSEVFGLKTVKGSSIVCAKLNLDEGSAVTEIRRIRYLNREPVSIDYSWVPDEVGSRLSEKNLREKDLFFLLENQLRQPLHSADLEIDATVASSEVAGRLKVAAGSPILRIERLTYVEQNKPLVFEYLHYRAETFKYKIKILR